MSQDNSNGDDVGTEASTMHANDQPPEMVRVPGLWRLKDDDPRSGLDAGDVLRCRRYRPDPHNKLEVLERVTDGHDPRCTVYRRQVERVMVPVDPDERAEWARSR